MTISNPKDPHVELRSIHNGIKGVMLEVTEQQTLWKKAGHPSPQDQSRRAQPPRHARQQLMGRKRKPAADGDAGKLREDVNETAFRVVQGATGEGPKPVPPEERADEEKDPTAVERGRKGGQKGGKARTETLTPEQRREIGKIAASARWKKKDQ